MSDCGKVLRAERERLGLSQKTMAALLRVSPAYLCDIEFGRRSLGEDRIALLPDCMKWPVAKALIFEHNKAIAKLYTLALATAKAPTAGDAEAQEGTAENG